MTLAETYSWIFYAIGPTPATYDGISQVADGINHAVPTQKEMQASIAWLVKNGLVLKEGKTVSLTNSGAALQKKGSDSSQTAFGVWKYLQKEIARRGADDHKQVDPNKMLA